MSDADALLAELNAHEQALQKLAGAIAAELDRGRAARITQVDILRPELMRHLRELNQTLLRCGQMHGGDRSNALVAAMNHLRFQATLWPACDRMIALQLPPRRRPLDHPRIAEPTPASALIAALDHLLGVMHAAHKGGPQSADAKAHSCHDDIPLAGSDFFATAHSAFRVLLARGTGQGTRFLDIGCGNGMKVISAAPYFEHCDGLEYRQSSVDAAQDLLARCGLPGCRVWQDDALTFDGYGGYDVIYLFRPVRDDTLLRELHARIVEQVDPGTLIIAPYLDFSRQAPGLGCGSIAEHLYATETDQDTADALREEAEYTGLSLRPPKRPGKGIWDAIIDISAARGFQPPGPTEDFVA